VDGHISTKKLFFSAAGEAHLTPQESWHLRSCEECLELRKLFARLASYDKPNTQGSGPTTKAVNE